MDNDSHRTGVCDESPFAITVSGRKIDLLYPDPQTICLRDIAWHLAMIPRFTGACNRPYSGAEHSVLVARLVKHQLDREDVPRTVEYWEQIAGGLFHDSEEYMYNDLSSPVKGIAGAPYKEPADRLRRAIFTRFGISYDYLNKTVKDADDLACDIEHAQLMPNTEDWPHAPGMDRFEKLIELNHREAYIYFLGAAEGTLTKLKQAREEEQEE